MLGLEEDRRLQGDGVLKFNVVHKDIKSAIIMTEDRDK